MAAHPIRISYKEVPGQATALQAGFSVSSRNFRKAVDRNRIKRLLRESYRKQKSILERPPASASQDRPLPGAPFQESAIPKPAIQEPAFPKPAIQEPAFPGSGAVDSPLAIFIIYTGKELPTYEFVDEKMKIALNKLGSQLRGQTR